MLTNSSNDCLTLFMFTFSKLLESGCSKSCSGIGSRASTKFLLYLYKCQTPCSLNWGVNESISELNLSRGFIVDFLLTKIKAVSPLMAIIVNPINFRFNLVFFILIMTLVSNKKFKFILIY
eukprot:NODE_435_length_8649_cov_0.394386.p7 type:complete len:121 gc:universal NODE_435_length_8649_cov_0.394386:6960-7322(+)